MINVPASRIYAAIAAAMGWFAVIVQLYLLLHISTTSVSETVIRFFSYFTILSNIIVAVSFTFITFNNSLKTNHFFLRAGTLTAITVYIIVVGAVYNIVLRFIWNPQGLQKFVDELLHSAIPLLTVVYWAVFVPKTTLQWRDSFFWLLYPLTYIIIVAIRGAFTGYYPYPFLNVPNIGYPRALLNGGILALVFLGLSLFLIAVAKWLSRKQAVD